MNDLNTFTFWRASCVQNPKNCYYPEKVIVRSAEDFNKMARFDHVCAQYKGNYRAKENLEVSTVQSGDVDNKGITDPKDWITREVLHGIFDVIQRIIRG